MNLDSRLKSKSKKKKKQNQKESKPNQMARRALRVVMTYVGFEERDVVFIERWRILLLQEIIGDVRHGDRELLTKLTFASKTRGRLRVCCAN
jgi:hypothetical protein